MNTNIKILIVDNEDKTFEALNSILQGYGYEVYWGNSGNEAIKLYDVLRPDLLVLDIGLRDMPGEIICAFIRQQSCIPIIILSAQNDEQSILSSFDIGADDYVAKPFSTPQLIARINALLRRNYAGAKQRNPA